MIEPPQVHRLSRTMLDLLVDRAMARYDVPTLEAWCGR